MTRSLSGKRALVTGSTHGLGLAVARRLAAAGCDVVIHGLGGPTAHHVDPADGGRVRHSSADLRDARQVAQLIGETVDAWGGIDVLVNNAVARHTGPVEAFEPWQWDESIAVNLSAAFHAIRLSLPSMKKNRWGRIVNVSSIYGLRGATNRVGYVTTKTALVGLTRAVALETAKDGITCNAVCPGTSESPVHELALQRLIASQAVARVDAEAQLLAGKQPTARLIAADGVAAVVAFLCSDEAADITGAALPIDAGWSAG